MRAATLDVIPVVFSQKIHFSQCACLLLVLRKLCSGWLVLEFRPQIFGLCVC